MAKVRLTMTFTVRIWLSVEFWCTEKANLTLSQMWQLEMFFPKFFVFENLLVIAMTVSTRCFLLQSKLKELSFRQTCSKRKNDSRNTFWNFEKWDMINIHVNMNVRTGLKSWLWRKQEKKPIETIQSLTLLFFGSAFERLPVIKILKILWILVWTIFRLHNSWISVLRVIFQKFCFWETLKKFKF